MRLTKEDFLKMSEKLYDKMSVQLDSEKQDFYNYASTLDELLTRYGQELLSESISDGEISERKKKTILTRYGKIKVSEQHSFSDAVHGFRISPYMQERMTYAGQSDVYNERNDLISKFLRIDINFMQVYRVTDKIGELSEGLVGEAESQALVVTAHDVVYAELDVNPIIKKVSDYEVSTKQGKIERQKLLNYLNTNAYRMQYHLYRARGLQIGSGAIESAQRTVLQKRLKRSGQRWSETGVQNMLNLRVAHLSNHWAKIVNTIVDYKAAA